MRLGGGAGRGREGFSSIPFLPKLHVKALRAKAEEESQGKQWHNIEEACWPTKKNTYNLSP